MKALIYDGRVVQLSEKEFPVSPSLTWVNADNSVTVGDIYDGRFIKPNPVEPKIVISLEEIASKVADLIDYCLGNITKEDLSKKVISIQEVIKDAPIN